MTATEYVGWEVDVAVARDVTRTSSSERGRIKRVVREDLVSTRLDNPRPAIEQPVWRNVKQSQLVTHMFGSRKKAIASPRIERRSTMTRRIFKHASTLRRDVAFSGSS